MRYSLGFLLRALVQAKASAALHNFKNHSSHTISELFTAKKHFVLGNKLHNCIFATPINFGPIEGIPPTGGRKGTV